MPPTKYPPKNGDRFSRKLHLINNLEKEKNNNKYSTTPLQDNTSS
jgi:hypothetical protein